MRKNTDQKNSEYGYFSHSDSKDEKVPNLANLVLYAYILTLPIQKAQQALDMMILCKFLPAEDTPYLCMIQAASFLSCASINNLNRWIVGSSRCKSKLKLVKIDMAHWLNSKAGSKSGFENQPFKRRNRSSLKSSLTKYDRKLGNFLRIRTKQHSNESHRADRCLSTD